MAQRKAWSDSSIPVTQATCFFEEQELKSPQILGKILYKDIIFDKQLGDGYSSKVYLGSYKGEQLVIKKYKSAATLDKSSRVMQQKKQDEIDKRFSAECKYLAVCSPSKCILYLDKSFPVHPSEYIIRLVDYCQRSDDSPGVLLIEYAENGDLESYQSKNPLTFEQKMIIANDVAIGLLILLQLSLVHRDIKAANILLTKQLRAKICDLEFARSRYTDLDEEIGIAGSPCNLAPEYYEHSSFSVIDGLPAADVFSFGTLLMDLFVDPNDALFKAYEDIYGHCGFRLNDEIEPKNKVTLIEEIIKKSPLLVPDSFRDDLRRTMQSCLVEDPSERATIKIVQANLRKIIDRLNQPQEQVIPSVPAEEKVSPSVVGFQDTLQESSRRGLITQTIFASPKNMDTSNPPDPHEDILNLMGCSLM